MAAEYPVIQRSWGFFPLSSMTERSISVGPIIEGYISSTNETGLRYSKVVLRVRSGSQKRTATPPSNRNPNMKLFFNATILLYYNLGQFSA